MLTLVSENIRNIQTEAFIIPVCEDADIHEETFLLDMDHKAKSLKEFKGESGDIAVFYHEPAVASERIMCLGIGKKKKISPEVFRSFAGKAVSKCIQMNLSNIVVAAPSSSEFKANIDTIVQAILEGACLGNHVYDAYKNEKKQKAIEQIGCYVPSDVRERNSRLPSKIETICQGTIIAREWVSMPSNDKKPELLVQLIESQAKKYDLKITVLDDSQLKAQKFGAILAVASGSESKPALMMIEYCPPSYRKSVVLVGKGVTFDAGGINLKPGSNLDTMKCDMAGAAAVASVVITASRLNYPHRVIGVIPMAENMPSGTATRPGDIIRTWSGKTVEIGNTDAEGRLLLADAISYAIDTYRPDILIDVATLTGACVVALGDKIAGVFSPDDRLAQLIVDSGNKLHERCWRLPLPDDYKELYKSKIADINNVSESRSAGAIVGALFIAEFVKDTPWAHIDIAGPAYSSKESDYCPEGGTGFGVRLLCDVLENI